jgi:magnesium chelatase family protein
MSIKVTGIGLKGMEGYRVNVEVKALGGVESIVIVGLPDASVKESKDRITAALHSMGISLADQKIIISLSPSEQKKNGPMFDLAMAICVMRSLGELKIKIAQDIGFIGALSLYGISGACHSSNYGRFLVKKYRIFILLGIDVCKYSIRRKFNSC